MKRLSWLLVIPVIFGLTLFTGCEDPLAEGEAITITIGSGAVTEAVVGDIISFDVSVVAEAKIDEIEIRKGTTTIETVTDFQNSDSHVYSFEYEVLADDAGETLEFAFIVYDKKDNEESKTYTVEIATGLITHDAITLGAQSNTTGSFCASFDGTVYKISELTGNYGKVDVIYYYGATNKAALFSPKSIVDNNITWSDAVATSNWGTPNATKFVKSTLDFDNATLSEIQSAASGASSDIANGDRNPVDGLQVGDVYAFTTLDSRVGLIKVTAVTAAADGSITFSVKIAE